MTAVATKAMAGACTRRLNRVVFEAPRKESETRVMAKKMYVGSLSWDTTDDGLRNAFATHGEVTDVAVIKDRDTGRSRGFGFVTMADDTEAKAAMAALDGTDLDGRTIKVNEAQDKKPRNDRGGGGGNRDRW